MQGKATFAQVRGVCVCVCVRVCVLVYRCETAGDILLRILKSVHTRLRERERESCSKQEVVVNKNFQVYPAYRVTYRPGGALPDPLSRAGNDALKTFDEYKASDFHCQAQNVLLPHMLCHRREEAEATWQRHPGYGRWMQEKSH